MPTSSQGCARHRCSGTVGELGGGTIGGVAGGIYVAYPPENSQLQAKVAAQSLVVAEMPVGTQPQARHFPRRNRIIAGLCAETIVIEAAPKSGSLITARLAAEAGREVMAVPGSPLDLLAQGCNALIRDGATLVQSAADVLETLGSIAGHMAAPETRCDPGPVALEASDAEHRAIVGLLSATAVAVDELLRQSGLASATVAGVLLDLELAGRLMRHASGLVAAA